MSHASLIASLQICTECLGTESKNRNGNAEKLTSCAECGTTYHPTCIPSGNLLSVILKKDARWFCEDCRNCTICKKTTQDISLLCCSGCDKTYHLKCMDPPCDKKSKTPWRCRQCSMVQPKSECAITNNNNKKQITKVADVIQNQVKKKLTKERDKEPKNK